MSMTQVSLAAFMEAQARRGQSDVPGNYGYKADVDLGVGFYVCQKTKCMVMEKPICVPSGKRLAQGYMMLYAYCQKAGAVSILEGQLPPVLPATELEPSQFDSLAAIANNFGAKDPQAAANNSAYCVAIRVPAELCTQAETPGRNIWMVRFDMDKVSPILQAAKEGDAAAMAKGLLCSGLKADLVDEHGVSALMMAAMAGSVETCKQLLKHGADAAGPEPMAGRTPLMFAAQAGHCDVLALLLENGAEASTADLEGTTALMWASVAGKAAAAKLLAAHGFKDTQNKDGLTALGLAVKMGHTETAAALTA